MVDLTARSFLFQSLGKHELAHPVDAFVPRFDGEMMRLAGAGVEKPLLISRRDELKAKGRDVFFLVLFVVDLQGSECRIELVRSERRAGDCVFIDINVLERFQGFGVSMHGKRGTVEAAMMLVPFMAKHSCLALFHPSGMIDLDTCWSFRIVDWGEVSLL